MNVPEYMRIRQYLYDLIDRADGSNLQIPPESELCRLFGVSRIPVRAAIKGMVKDRLLTPRRGLGTFMNPEIIGKGVKRTPLVGLIVHDGRAAMGSFDPLVAQCVLDAGLRFEPFFIPESEDPERFLEIVKSGMDAIVWSSGLQWSLKFLEPLAANAIPCLTIDLEIDKAPSACDAIVSDKSDRGAELAKLLHSHGHAKMLFVHNFQERRLPAALGEGSTHFACRKSLARFWRGGKESCADAMPLLEFESLDAAGLRGLTRRWSVIYALAESAPDISAALAKAGLSIPEDISFVACGEASSRYFKGLEPCRVDFARSLRTHLADWLDLRVREKDFSKPFARDARFAVMEGKTLARIGGQG